MQLNQMELVADTLLQILFIQKQLNYTLKVLNLVQLLGLTGS